MNIYEIQKDLLEYIYYELKDDDFIGLWEMEGICNNWKLNKDNTQKLVFFILKELLKAGFIDIGFPDKRGFEVYNEDERNFKELKKIWDEIDGKSIPGEGFYIQLDRNKIKEYEDYFNELKVKDWQMVPPLEDISWSELLEN